MGVRTQRPRRYRCHRVSAAGLSLRSLPASRSAPALWQNSFLSSPVPPFTSAGTGACPSPLPLRSSRYTCLISLSARRSSASWAATSAKRAWTGAVEFFSGSSLGRSCRCPSKLSRSTWSWRQRCWRSSPSSSSCALEARVRTSRAPCCSPLPSLSSFHRTTPGTSPGWCHSSASIPSLG